MKKYLLILSFVALMALLPQSLWSQQPLNLSVEYFGDSLQLHTNSTVDIPYSLPVSEQGITAFYNTLDKSNYSPVVDSLLSYRKMHALNDWFYYQLIRRTAEQIAPKADNYTRYTLYKWFLLVKSGYDAKLALGRNELLLYVKSTDSIYDIPYYVRNGDQYVCLNIHDYANADIYKDSVQEIEIEVPGAASAFSYAIDRLPEFKADEYTDKELAFNFDNKTYHFLIKINPLLKKVFANYPVVDFASYFNIPMSRETYNSLISLLKKNIKGMSQEQGVDYLMCFSRYAFLYENDQQNFGKEKHMSPEETLLYDHSDCDDRAALFFYLVKEIYNLPMIALLYPSHITVAIQFDSPVGTPVIYNGKKYSVCDPTSQAKALGIGDISPDLRDKSYKVVYSYEPVK